MLDEHEDSKTFPSVERLAALFVHEVRLAHFGLICCFETNDSNVDKVETSL